VRWPRTLAVPHRRPRTYGHGIDDPRDTHLDAASPVPRVVAGTAGSRVEADLKRAALEDAGIDAVVGADDAGGLHPEMGSMYLSAYRLLVGPADLDDATRLLAELDAGVHALEEPGAHEALPRDRTPAWVGRLVIAVAVAFVLFRVLESARSFGLF
jgi:hypothetical protein